MKKPPRDYFETIHRPTLMTVPFTTENAIVEKGVEAAITNGPIVPAGDLEDGASIQVAKVSKRSVNVEQKFSCFRMQARSMKHSSPANSFKKNLKIVLLFYVSPFFFVLEGGKDLIVKRGCLYTDSKAEVFGEWAAVHGNNKHVHFSACDKSFCNGTGCGLFLSVPLIIAIIGGWSFNFIKL